MTTRVWSRLGAALAHVPLIAAACFVLLYVVLAVMRMGYPFELEWMEGGSLGQVSWIASGHKLYGPPSLEFTPWVYPPLYFYLAAAVSSVLDGGLFPLRLLSFVCSLGSIALIFAMVRGETGSARAAALSGGLFAATYQLGGAWFDLARSDSLFLVLLLAAFYVLRWGGSSRAAVTAGVLLALSFFSKQTALVAALPLALYCTMVDWRRGFWFAATAAIVIAGGTLILDRWQDGWFSYYVFVLPGRLSSRVIPERVVYFWTRDVGMPLVVAFSLGLFHALDTATQPSRGRWFCFALALGLLVSAWIPRIQSGGFQNTAIPAYAAISLLFGLGLEGLRRTLAPIDELPGAQLRVLLELLCAMQFAVLVYNPLTVLPKRGDLAAGHRVVQRLAQVDGDVLAFSQSYLAVMAGKRPTAHAAAILDVLGWGSEQQRSTLAREVREALAAGRFKAVVADGRNDSVFGGNLDNYDDAGPLFDDPRAFWPVTGYRVRPERLYILREPARR